VAVCLYALATTESQAEPEAPASNSPLPKARPSLAQEESERLLAVLMDVVHHSQTRRVQSDARYAEHLRRLLLRLNPGRRDTQILLGILRRVLWRLQEK